MTFLTRILSEKANEVTELKKIKPEQPLNKGISTFKSKVKASNQLTIIAEIKRSSPSKGAIHMNVDPIKQAKLYEKSGAAAISVLTDRPFFNGSFEDLRAVREAVNVPILCKDFIIDPIQIDHAKAAGANIILLIVAALSQEQFSNLYHYAKQLDLEILCEVHHEAEMLRVLELQPDIIGINNRNLRTFEVDLQTTEKLAAMVTNRETILISESGMKTKEDAMRAVESGAHGILVGETLMRTENVPATIQQLQIPLPVKGAN